MNSNTNLLSPPLNALSDTNSIYNPALFGQLAAIAEMMAMSSLIPETLTKDKAGVFPIEKIKANCFLIAEQSHRWGMSPFAVAQCASVVYGRLMWEGKLVAGVITEKLGITLDYEYAGEGEKMTVIVNGTLQGESKARTVSGSVASWKTDQWSPKNYEQRLAYRGAREWARRHAPGVMLGIVTDDDDYEEPKGMRNVTRESAQSVDAVNPFPVKPAPAIEAPAPVQAVKAKAAPAAPAPDTASAPSPASNPSASKGERRGHVTGVASDGEQYIVTVKGANGEAALIAENAQIAQKAEDYQGFECKMQIKKEGSKYLLTAIEIIEEGGDLV
jgi:hypothetical protein